MAQPSVPTSGPATVSRDRQLFVAIAKMRAQLAVLESALDNAGPAFSATCAAQLSVAADALAAACERFNNVGGPDAFRAAQNARRNATR